MERLGGKDYLGRALEKVKALTDLSLYCDLCITCCHLLYSWSGPSWNARLLTMWCKGHNDPYPIWLKVGIATRAMQMEACPGVPFRSRHNREGTKEIKANLTRQEAIGIRFGRPGESILWEWQYTRWFSMAYEGGPKTQTDVFPDVFQTTLRRYIVLCSVEDTTVIIIELCVPWEEGCDEAYEKKDAKYWELRKHARIVVGKPRYFP